MRRVPASSRSLPASRRLGAFVTAAAVTWLAIALLLLLLVSLITVSLPSSEASPPSYRKLCQYSGICCISASSEASVGRRIAPSAVRAEGRESATGFGGLGCGGGRRAMSSASSTAGSKGGASASAANRRSSAASAAASAASSASSAAAAATPIPAPMQTEPPATPIPMPALALGWISAPMLLGVCSCERRWGWC